MALRRPGPPPKGQRSQFTVRLPSEHAARYLKEAERRKMPFSDYLAEVLARAHGEPLPDYLTRNRGQGELDVVSA